MPNVASLPFVTQQTEALAAALLHEIGESKFAAWFKNAVFERGPDGALVVVVETKFMADWIRTHFGGELRHAALCALGAFKEVRIIVSAKASQSLPAPSDSAPLSNVVQFPLWPESVRGVPNSFLRSALFAAIQGKQRRYLDDQLLASLEGVSVRFTGKQLDQSDCDVWAQAAHFARNHPLGDTCQFKGHAFLKSINRASGKTDYGWLDHSLKRLVACAVEIKIGKRAFVGSLITKYWRDDETGIFKVVFEPMLLNLFFPDDWSAMHFEQRLVLKGKPLAQWLHGFYSSHASAYPMKVETLHRLCGSANKDMWGFKRDLKKAFVALEAFGWRAIFDGDLVSVERPPSEAQVRHLTNRTAPPKRLRGPSPSTK